MLLKNDIIAGNLKYKMSFVKLYKTIRNPNTIV